MWLMIDEGHIITFAVHPAWRRQHVGERLLLSFLDLASDRGAHEATLEVRLSNLPARRLYEKFGFRPVGPASSLLQRQWRGRTDHDHRTAGRAVDARAGRASPGRGRRRAAAAEATDRRRRDGAAG
jgi:RimJ/RimL family protein N-acetyltransferase